jgi:CarboxypepD_reg-like domain
MLPIRSIGGIMLLLFLSTDIIAQIKIKGIVKDAQTLQPLAFCTVTAIGQRKNCLTNEDGRFELSLQHPNDTLRFDYLGYDLYRLPIGTAYDMIEARLQHKSYELSAVDIYPDDDYLYELVGRCRQQLKATKKATSKVYFSLDTEIGQKPVEVLECYYNGTTRAGKVQDLAIKSGRIGLAEQADGHIFVSLNTSEALRLVDLTEGHKLLPASPLEYPSRRIKKLFKLARKASGDSMIIRIAFVPDNPRKNFEGELWIDRKTAQIRKISLSADQARVHPFEPIRPGDSLLQVSLEIQQGFGADNQLQHIFFSYDIAYLRGLENNSYAPSPQKIYTTGRMYFYDYDRPFLLPLFDYVQYDAGKRASDYHSIANMPYNRDFWTQQTGLVYTERQTNMLRFLANEGKLLNFSGNQLQSAGVQQFFFEHNNVVWSDTTRVLLRAAQTPAKDASNYRLVGQIFLDLYDDGDSIKHYSATVLDVLHSRYQSGQPREAACFLNIYFDMCEMIRRDMEANIAQLKNPTIEQLIAQHEEATQKINKMTRSYLLETHWGISRKALEKHNQKVIDGLGIDNIKAFGIDK